jgi:hypothetical protein
VYNSVEKDIIAYGTRMSVLNIQTWLKGNVSDLGLIISLSKEMNCDILTQLMTSKYIFLRIPGLNVFDPEQFQYE